MIFRTLRLLKIVLVGQLVESFWQVLTVLELFLIDKIPQERPYIDNAVRKVVV